VRRCIGQKRTDLDQLDYNHGIELIPTPEVVPWRGVLTVRGRLADLHPVSGSHALRIGDVAIMSIASIGSARDLLGFTRERGGGADVHKCIRERHIIIELQ
jgi:hypothetical protein